ncbi:MAG: hypothetical protein ABMA01_19115 [Chthoniobacteraceae bacterium]
MSRPLKTVLVVAAFIVVIVGVATFVFQRFTLHADTFEYSGARITPDVVTRFCPAYARTEGARILHIHHIEGMNGGQTTIQLELPANQLQTFLAASPIKEASLQSKSVPGELLDPKWLPQQHSNELQNKGTFSAGSFSAGGAHHIILIDRSRSDVYVIHIQTTS